MWTPLILAIALVAWLPFYIYTEYRWQKNKYLITKLIASLIFLSIGIVAFVVLRPTANYAVWIIVALFFGMIGDGLLVYVDNIKFFKLGLVSFLIGQIIYGVTFLSIVGFVWIDIVLYIIIVVAAIFAYSKLKLNLDKMKIPVLMYLLIISFMFVMAFSSTYKGGFNAATTALVSVGASLFLVSDIVLAFVVFEDKPAKPLRAINLSLYYCAQMLLALSVATFGA